MSLVRRHLVTAVSLVIALATGIALGAGPLSRESLVPTTAEPRSEAPAADESGDDLAEAVTPELADGVLEGSSVAVLTTPGSSADHADALTTAVEDAGGRVDARWKVGRSLVAASETALVDTLGEQLLEQLSGDLADADAPPYVRMGQLLGAAVATRTAQPEVPDRPATTVRQSLDAASLLTTTAEEPRTAPVLVVVLGDDVEDAIVEGLTEGLADRARRVVVVAEDREGDLTALEEEGLVTTVDGVGGATGRLATVLALAADAEDPPGSYGASGSDGVLPLR